MRFSQNNSFKVVIGYLLLVIRNREICQIIGYQRYPNVPRLKNSNFLPLTSINMLFWIQFRLVQFFRLLQRAGFGLLLATLVLMVPFLDRVLGIITEAPDIYLALGGFLLSGLLHGYRADRRFLEQGALPVRWYCAIDYALVLLVVGILPVVQGRPIALAMFGGLLWVFLPPGFLRTAHKSRKVMALPDWVPVQAIEWRLLIRRQWPGWVLAGVILLASFFHFAFYLGAMSIGLLLIGASMEHLEPFAMLPVNTGSFLKRWRAGADMMYGWLVPGSIYLVVVQPAWWPLVLYVAAVYELYWLFNLSYKYSAWAPGRRRIYAGAAPSFAMLFAIIPGGIIALAGMAGWYFYRGQRLWR